MTEHVPCKFEDRIIEMIEGVARSEAKIDALDKRINGALDAAKHHIEAGSKWRLAVLCSCVGLVGLFVTFMAQWGAINEIVDSHEKRIVTIEELHPRGKVEK